MFHIIWYSVWSVIYVYVETHFMQCTFVPKEDTKSLFMSISRVLMVLLTPVIREWVTLLFNLPIECCKFGCILSVEFAKGLGTMAEANSGMVSDLWSAVLGWRCLMGTWAAWPQHQRPCMHNQYVVSSSPVLEVII